MFYFIILLCISILFIVNEIIILLISFEQELERQRDVIYGYI